MTPERLEKDIQRVLDENKRRWEWFNRPYDPLVGIGCYGERRPVQLVEGEPAVLMPARMWDEPGLGELLDRIHQAGGFEAAKAKFRLGDQEDAAIRILVTRARAKWDPEFWFVSAVRIRTKRRSYQPFILNSPQRLYLALLLDQFFAGVPVRVILVKARQWGGSTLTQLLMAWVQQWWQKSWNIAIVADVQQQSLHIRNMYTTLQRFYPKKLFGTITFRNYEGLSNVRFIPERESIIGVASTKNPNSIRSYTYHMLHLSEVGLWKSTPEQNASDLAQSLEGGLVGGARTFCVLESTAKGMGGYFHQQWEAAVKGESNYTPFFVGWWQIPEYTTELGDLDPAAFVASWTDYDWELWRLGATIEGIRWYHEKRASMPAAEREWRMKEEFPSTADEAFQSSGQRVFHPDYVRQARVSCRPPIAVGNLLGASIKGEGALRYIKWIDNPNGFIRVWRWPGDDYGGMLDLHRYVIRDRYCAFADIGGRTHRADKSVVTILDRAPMIAELFDEPGPPEVVAQFRGNLDQDLFAWEAVRLCAWYDNAFLAVEKNSLRRQKATDGEADSPHYLTILDEIKEYYPFLYFTEKHDDLRGEKYTSYGFHTSTESKAMIIDTLNAALRDRAYIERASEACDEMDYFETKDDGRMGAREGKHDDLVISRAGVVWLALKQMAPPRVHEKDKPKKKEAVGMAVF